MSRRRPALAVRLLARARAGEDGIALASVVTVLLIVLTVTAIGAAVAISAVSGSSRDRSSTNAFAAAEAALDITNWRMNRLVVANEVGGLLDMSEGSLQTLGCVRADGGADAGPLTVEASGDTCEITIGDLDDGTEATCTTEVVLDLSAPGVLADVPNESYKILYRGVTCSATVNDVTRRVHGRFGLRVRLSQLGDTVQAPLSLWRRYAWVECPADEEQPCPPGPPA